MNKLKIEKENKNKNKINNIQKIKRMTKTGRKIREPERYKCLKIVLIMLLYS